MEYTTENNSSDKDKKMLGHFESYSETEKSEESELKKKKKRRSSGESHKDSEERAEQKETSRQEAKEQGDDSETDDKHSIDKFFERNSEASDDTESEPALPSDLEKLSEEEAEYVARKFAQARDAELQVEHADTEPDSEDEAEVLANAMYIDNFIKNLEGGQSVDEAELAAANETLDELDIIATAEAIDTADSEIESVGADSSPGGIEDELSNLTAESPTDTSEDDISSNTTHQATPFAHSSNSGVSMPAGSGGGMTGRVSAGVTGSAFPPGTPNINAVGTNQNMSERKVSPESSVKHRRGADILVGGIIGYLIGRRRGRIKTEERMEPVQKSLEKEVKNLNEKISIREKKIRSLTSEKIAKEGEEAKKKISDKVEAKARAKFEAREADKAGSEKDTQISPAIEQEIEENSNSAWQEQETRHAERRPERLASVLLAKPELTTAIRTETTASAANEIVHKMPEAELLAVAAKIEHGGQNAKMLYEQGRISKEDLRGVVIEHVRGNGKAEALLAERLHPVKASETMERLQREGAGSSTQDGGPGGGGTPIHPGWNSQTHGSHAQSKDVSAIADAMISEHAAKEHRNTSQSAAWIVAGAVAATVVAALLLF